MRRTTDTFLAAIDRFAPDLVSWLYLRGSLGDADVDRRIQPEEFVFTAMVGGPGSRCPNNARV
ncbi:MAG: hypothetical protein J2P17_24035 [Mycobacterium sp.]|nr:hypothetical protein [Mycobacterium sp.]